MSTDGNDTPPADSSRQEYTLSADDLSADRLDEVERLAPSAASRLDDPMDADPWAKEPFQFSVGHLLMLTTAASLVLGILQLFPAEYAAGLAGLGALLCMIVLIVWKPVHAWAYLAWWVMLAIYALVSVTAAIEKM